jgi:Holliday junction resolvase RusA-like endonuclease
VASPIGFRVVGAPVTQGSKVAHSRNGHVWMTEAGGKRHADWRSAVADAARRANPGELWTGPVFVHLIFSLPKPASAPKKRRTWPIGARSGDVDKLARCVLDALTSTVLRDDAQVVTLIVWKGYGDPPGVGVTVTEVRDDAWMVTPSGV